MKQLFVLYLCLISTSSVAFLVRENVIFSKITEVSLSTASWKLSLLVDLNAYQNIFSKFLDHLTKIDAVLKNTMSTYRRNKVNTFQGYYSDLKSELVHINKTRKGIVEKFESFRSLHNADNRRKRALVPFIGKIYGWLFGLTTESDLSDIRRAVNDLGTNQQKFSHVLERSITILDKSRENIAENRDRINEIYMGLGKLSAALSSFIVHTNEAHNKILLFLHFYLHLASMINNAQELVIEMSRGLEDLARQLDILSTGKISPAVISPPQLREALSEIEKNLPPNLRLPNDPEQDLWSYYRTIACGSLMLENKIVIILHIPLIDYTNKMELYKADSLPLPNLHMSTGEGKENDKSMLASYRLETTVFAIDKNRVRYTLLSENEANRCARTENGYCQFVDPLYPTNVSKFCIIALFLGNKERVKKSCVVHVEPSGIIPVARHISRGLWAVATNKPIQFTNTCSKRSSNSVETVTLLPPIDTIRLESGCTAFSAGIVLPSYQEFASSVDITPELSLDVRNQSYSLWEPFHEVIDSINMTWNLSSLKDIEKINMKELVNTLHTIKKVRIDPKEFWTTTNSVIATVIVIIVLIAVFFFIKKFRNDNYRFPMMVFRKTAGRMVPTTEESKPFKETRESIPMDEKKTHAEQIGQPNFSVYPNAPLA